MTSELFSLDPCNFICLFKMLVLLKIFSQTGHFNSSDSFGKFVFSGLVTKLEKSPWRSSNGKGGGEQSFDWSSCLISWLFVSKEKDESFSKLLVSYEYVLLQSWISSFDPHSFRLFTLCSVSNSLTTLFFFTCFMQLTRLTNCSICMERLFLLNA